VKTDPNRGSVISFCVQCRRAKIGLLQNHLQVGEDGFVEVFYGWWVDRGGSVKGKRKGKRHEGGGKRETVAVLTPREGSVTLPKRREKRGGKGEKK